MAGELRLNLRAPAAQSTEGRDAACGAQVSGAACHGLSTGFAERMGTVSPGGSAVVHMLVAR